MELHFITKEQDAEIFKLGFKSDGFTNRDTGRIGILKSEFFKWAREKYHIFCAINVDAIFDYPDNLEPKFYYSISKYFPLQRMTYNSDLYDTYEEAENKMISHIINGEKENLLLK